MLRSRWWLLLLLTSVAVASRRDSYSLRMLLKQDRSLKIPKIMQRMYREWTSKPVYEPKMIKSIPVQVTHMEERTLLLTAPYTRDKKSTVQNAELWMEFQNRRRNTPSHQATYVAYIKPTSENCDHSIQFARVPAHVHDSVRLRFNITSLYLSCKSEDLEYLQLSIRLGSEDSPLDLSSSQADAFILLQEELQDDGSDLVSVASHEIALKAFEKLGRRRREAGGIRLKNQDGSDDGSDLASHKTDMEAFEHHLGRRRLGAGGTRLKGHHRKEDGSNLLGVASHETTMEAFGHPGRRRREAAVTRPGRPDRLCRPQKWYVKFKDLGWDWVIAPPVGFRANRCRGKCSFPLTTLMNSTNHAVVQTLVHSIFGRPRGACCVAKELAPLTMLFQENNGIVIMKMYPDMVVKSCACL